MQSTLAQRDALGKPINPGDRIVIARQWGASRVRMFLGTVTRFGPGRRIYFQPNPTTLGPESWTSPERTILIQTGSDN
jgi:hypothetical protein